MRVVIRPARDGQPVQTCEGVLLGRRKGQGRLFRLINPYATMSPTGYVWPQPHVRLGLVDDDDRVVQVWREETAPKWARRMNDEQPD